MGCLEQDEYPQCIPKQRAFLAERFGYSVNQYQKTDVEGKSGQQPRFAPAPTCARVVREESHQQIVNGIPDAIDDIDERRRRDGKPQLFGVIEDVETGKDFVEGLQPKRTQPMCHRRILGDARSEYTRPAWLGFGCEMHCRPPLTAISGQRRCQGEQAPSTRPRISAGMRSNSTAPRMGRLLVVANDKSDMGQSPAKLWA